MMARLAIVTQSDDLHAYAVRHELLSRGNDCEIIETDRLSGAVSGTTWGTNGTAPSLPSASGVPIDPRKLDLVWWRRVRMYGGGTLRDPAHIDLVANDCQASLLGTLLASFKGRWIDHPSSIRAAENKILQLSLAQEVGLRVPRTLVSQDPESVRSFLAGLDCAAIVKSVRGTPKAPLVTTEVYIDRLTDRDISLSPAIYQELIPGSRHFRVNVFGDRVLPALIQSDELDWRPRPDNPTSSAKLDDETTHKLLRLLELLELRMGVFDLKMTDAGEIFWLEVNPQGQFLFVQALSGMDLVGSFCDFVNDEMKSVLDTSLQ
jgi:hypothetical protein